MHCTHCGKELGADAAICQYCGTATHATRTPPRRLSRRSSEGRVAGVCAGIAEYLDTDVTLIRLIWVVLSIVPGMIFGGVLAYAAAWIVMPDTSAPMAPVTTESARLRLRRSTSDRKIGGVCGGLAEYLGADSTLIRLIWVVLTIVPGVIFCGVAAYIVAWFIMPPDSVDITVAPSAA